MGILQFLSQSKEALQGGVNELQQTGGGILKYLTDTYKKEKEEYYKPTPEVRPRDVLRESKLTLQNIGSKLQPPEMSQGEAMKQGLVKAGNTYIDPMFVGSLEKVGAKAVKPAVKPLVGKIMNKVDDTLNPLLTEVKKYKSADEFVKAQGTPVYHGTKIENVSSIEKSGLKVGQNILKEERGMVWVSEKVDGAKTYGDSVVELNIPKNSKIINRQTKLTQQQADILSKYSYYKIKAGETFDNAIEKIVRTDSPKIKTPENVIQTALKDLGYDGVRDGNNLLLNPEQIKTKSQLTNIWNKANK